MHVHRYDKTLAAKSIVLYPPDEAAFSAWQAFEAAREASRVKLEEEIETAMHAIEDTETTLAADRERRAEEMRAAWEKEQPTRKKKDTDGLDLARAYLADQRGGGVRLTKAELREIAARGKEEQKLRDAEAERILAEALGELP